MFEVFSVSTPKSIPPQGFETVRRNWTFRILVRWQFKPRPDVECVYYASLVIVSLTFELESFQNLQVVPFLFLLAFDLVEHESAQAQVAHKNDETDEPSSDHCFRRRGCGSHLSLSRSVAVTIAAHDARNRFPFPSASAPVVDYGALFSMSRPSSRIFANRRNGNPRRDNLRDTIATENR